MIIPQRGVEKFVRMITDQCCESRQLRTGRGAWFKNYYLLGAESTDKAAVYNKTFAYLDDLASLLYSPVSLRFHIGNPDLPNILEQAKGRAAAAKIRNLCRRGDVDTDISEANQWALVKGRTHLKLDWKNGLTSTLIQPEAMGVLNENHGKLDPNMEAFSYTMMISTYQLDRMLTGNPNAAQLKRRAINHLVQGRPMPLDDNIAKQVIVGGWQPYQAAGGVPTGIKGVADWMSTPTPYITNDANRSYLMMDETWIWDDERDDWTTFQIIGDDVLLMGKYQRYNAMAWDPKSQNESSWLRKKHPFVEFTPNPLDGYYWGRSEITNVMLLQQAINARINGINTLLRLQEQPPVKFTSATGVNQNAYAKLMKPKGWWTDPSPNAKAELLAPEIPESLFATLHEYERMFDEMGGLPPIARGKGEQGVRGAAHAETLIRMFSPRFKDRALLVERSAEAVGALSLDLARAHEGDRLIAWVAAAQAGVEISPPEDQAMLVPPVPGQAAVYFRMTDVAEDAIVTVDSHSSSPAFAADVKGLVFDLFKIGAMGPDDVIEHTDQTGDPGELIAGAQRREVAKAEAVAQEQKLSLLRGGKGK